MKCGGAGAEHRMLMNRAETPGVLSERWQGWIVPTEIRVLFVIAPQTREWKCDVPTTSRKSREITS